MSQSDSVTPILQMRRLRPVQASDFQLLTWNQDPDETCIQICAICLPGPSPVGLDVASAPAWHTVGKGGCGITLGMVGQPQGNYDEEGRAGWGHRSLNTHPKLFPRKPVPRHICLGTLSTLVTCYGRPGRVSEPNGPCCSWFCLQVPSRAGGWMESAQNLGAVASTHGVLDHQEGVVSRSGWVRLQACCDCRILGDPNQSEGAPNSNENRIWSALHIYLKPISLLPHLQDGCPFCR